MVNKRRVISLRVTAFETYAWFFSGAIKRIPSDIWRLENISRPLDRLRPADYIEPGNRNAMGEGLGETGVAIYVAPTTTTRSRGYTIIKSQSCSDRPESMFARNQIPRYGDGNCDAKTNFVLSVTWWGDPPLSHVDGGFAYVSRKMRAREIIRRNTWKRAW